MKNPLWNQAERCVKYARMHRRWRRVAATAAAVVIVLTVYLLIMPAVTMENVPCCGMEEHVHTEECFGENQAEPVCGKEEHTHTEDCFQNTEETRLTEPIEGEAQPEAEEPEAEEPETEEPEQEEPEAEKPKIKEPETEEEMGPEDASEVEGIADLQMSEEEPAYRQTEELDFGSWIQAVTVQFRQNSWESWQDAPTENGVIQVPGSGNLLFSIQYTVPANTLGSGKDTITYQLPAGITLAAESSGSVQNDAGQNVGSYTIGTDGKISIVFNETYVTNNANGQPISGHISFDCSVESIGSDDAGNAKLEFNDTVSVDIKVTDKGVQNEDLKVEKTASAFDEKTGEIVYTIKVTSANGTAGEVSLNDVMSVVGLQTGSIKVDELNADAYTVVETNGGFSMTLPQMSAGTVYTITYKAQLTQNINGTQTAENKVTVNSVNSSGANLKDEASVTTQVKQELVDKTGVLSEDGATVTWTVTINQSQMDIGGWTLQDTLNGESYTGEVSINPAINGAEKISLPYTFPEGTMQTYTISYTTAADKGLGAGWITNTATLTPGSTHTPNNSVSDGANVGTWEVYNPLSKKAESVTEQEDGKTAVISWAVTIDASKGPIEAGWTYTDTLRNGQWYTMTQLQAMKTSLDTALANAGLELSYTISASLLSGTDGVGAEVAYENLTSDGKYKAYKLVFTDTLNKGEKFQFHYTSTAPVEGVTTGAPFSNNAGINNKVWSSDTAEYTPSRPVIVKTDSRAEGEDTSHNTGDSNMQADGVSTLEWKLALTIPENYEEEALTVKDTLPEGLELVYFSISSGEILSLTDITTPGRHEVNGYTITTAQNGRELTAELSGTLTKAVGGASDRVILFTVRAKIADGFVWPTVDGEEVSQFVNQVELRGQDGETLGVDSQTQTITNASGIPALSKQHGTQDVNNMPYSITVNPEGRDLVAGADTVTLVDVMSFTYYEPNGIVSATLVPDSVKVYKRNADGSRGDELSGESDYTYTYEEERNNQSGTVSARNTLRIILPDEQPLIVDYIYKFGGTTGSWHAYSNAASLEGVSGSGAQSGDSVSAQIQQSSAGANVVGITIYKVDAENNGKALNGAQFELYHWDGSAYVPVIDTNGAPVIYESGKNAGEGQVILADLTYNTAYKLVEIKAPEGYVKSTEPLYFCIAHADTTTYPASVPQEFTGTEYSSGAVIYYPNTKSPSSLVLNKRWFQENGSETARADGTIEIELWQKVTAAESADTTEKKYGTYTLTGPEWTLTLTDLPTSGENETGQLENYTYYVREVTVSGYVPSYDNNDGITEGTITIRNTATGSYELPETGGTGNLRYIMGGLMLMLTATLLYIEYRQHKWRERKTGGKTK